MPVDPAAVPVDPAAVPVDPAAVPLDPVAVPVDPAVVPVDPAAVPALGLADTVPVDEPTTLPEIIAEAPPATDVVALDANGDPLPMATQEAADVLATGDPMWCPAGVDPGGAGCTPSKASFNGASGLLKYLTDNAATYTGAGTIYIQSGNINSADQTGVLFDQDVLGLSGLTDLTLQGGWTGSTVCTGAACITGTTTFNLNKDAALEVKNWDS